jgi:hypothetical protein
MEKSTGVKMTQKKNLLISALIALIAVVGLLVLFIQGALHAAAADSLNKMLPEVEIASCSWNDVSSVVPGQFEGSPADFLAFKKGYHRMAICHRARAQPALQPRRHDRPVRSRAFARDGLPGNRLPVAARWLPYQLEPGEAPPTGIREFGFPGAGTGSNRRSRPGAFHRWGFVLRTPLRIRTCTLRVEVV